VGILWHKQPLRLQERESLSRAEERRRNTQDIKPDQVRYWRTLIFSASVAVNIIIWEIILAKVLGERVVGRNRSTRLRRYARRFRRLAATMGGVMIKLGQFVSARVDVMPEEIIEELSGLQDEVPPEDFGDIQDVIEEELGASINHVYADFERQPKAAASLGQVHAARLNSGERVVVKVQRPNIEKLIATDLAALRVVARWLMLWKLISRRANVPALTEEFARTLWEEIDYEAEMDNADRFREMFADDMQVYVPSLYRGHSNIRVITMEDVTSLKITDTQAIDAAGVNRTEAARKLSDMYLQMIFDHGFFHADPHPGNIFLYPLPDEAIEKMYGRRNGFESRPFYIVFVDFGMVGHITERIQEGLREFVIAVGTRDTRRLVDAYRKLDILLPGADLARIEQAHDEAFDLVWGRSTMEVAQMSQDELEAIAMKYSDLLFDMPFQVPQDFIYLGRALGILSGITVQLDEDFNPWENVGKYAQKLIQRQTRSTNVVQELANIGGRAIGLPNRLGTVAERLERGDIDVRVRPNPATQRELRRIEYAARGVNRSVVFAAFLITATLFFVNGFTVVGIVGYVISAVAWLALALRRKVRIE
jgi:predicted unusual protein kinase regulating ubiquinone biosynthesis (AarF/ABC1/UbiB family)